MDATCHSITPPILRGICNEGHRWPPLSLNRPSFFQALCRPAVSLSAGHLVSASILNDVPLRNVGQSELRVSRLCFGTMTFGEGTNYTDACLLLNLAVDSGINFFDSAEMYPVPQRAETHGLSESFFGRWLKQSGYPRDRFVIATKVAGPSGQMVWIRGGPSAVDASNISAAIDGSLKRLGTEHIDLYQVHWPDRYVPMFGDVDYDCTRNYSSVRLEVQLEALSKAVDAGKIRHIGVSNETPWGVMDLCRLASQSAHLKKIVSVQNAYSLLCRTFDSGLAECCHRENIGMLAYSPLAMGLLTGKYYRHGKGGPQARLNKYRGRYAEAEGRYPMENPRVRRAVLDYCEIADKHGMSPAVLALSFVLRNPLVASAVIGATSVAQLEELVEALHVDLSDEVMGEINRVHSMNPNPTP